MLLCLKKKVDPEADETSPVEAVHGARRLRVLHQEAVGDVARPAIVVAQLCDRSVGVDRVGVSRKQKKGKGRSNPPNPLPSRPDLGFLSSPPNMRTPFEPNILMSNHLPVA